MTVETPDHYGGKPIPEDAIEIALAAEKKKKDENEDRAQGEAPSLEGFIYVRSVDLYFAKERTLLDHNWDDTHRELHKQNLRMPTIPQFVEFLKYLRADLTGENKQIYDEITKIGHAWKRVWLDASFYNGGLCVAYNHIVDSNGEVLAQNHERLEGHLMQDKCPATSLEHWLNNPTKQGLPPENSEPGDLWYWQPEGDRVAIFYAVPDGIGKGLKCDVKPTSSHPELGVFACAENLGGNQ